jgi:hypothetical protein
MALRKPNCTCLGQLSVTSMFAVSLCKHPAAVLAKYCNLIQAIEWYVLQTAVNQVVSLELVLSIALVTKLGIHLGTKKRCLKFRVSKREIKTTQEL